MPTEEKVTPVTEPTTALETLDHIECLYLDATRDDTGRQSEIGDYVRVYIEQRVAELGPTAEPGAKRAQRTAGAESVAGRLGLSQDAINKLALVSAAVESVPALKTSGIRHTTLCRHVSRLVDHDRTEGTYTVTAEHRDALVAIAENASAKSDARTAKTVGESVDRALGKAPPADKPIDTDPDTEGTAETADTDPDTDPDTEDLASSLDCASDALKALERGNTEENCHILGKMLAPDRLADILIGYSQAVEDDCKRDRKAGLAVTDRHPAAKRWNMLAEHVKSLTTTLRGRPYFPGYIPGQPAEPADKPIRGKSKKHAELFDVPPDDTADMPIDLEAAQAELEECMSVGD